MTASLRQAATTVVSTLIEGASMAAALIGGVAGAIGGYQLAPTTWPGDARLALAGAVAVIGAIAVDGLVELALAPLRRLTWRNRSTTGTSRTAATAPAPATSVDQALTQVTAATETDAANRAAFAAYRLDRGEGFLRDEERWRGYEDGEATFYLAPGLYLHHRAVSGDYALEHEFTLLSADSEPVTVTGIDQIRHQLAARAAGLPVSVPADDATGTKAMDAPVSV
ncbi:hypothetical protein [Streptomyces niveus]|uniref:hypothetical protein n=1 Tax=Streptomyces niveus TaxID=193462 RepID=UPI00379ACBFA